MNFAVATSNHQIIHPKSKIQNPHPAPSARAHTTNRRCCCCCCCCSSSPPFLPPILPSILSIHPSSLSRSFTWSAAMSFVDTGRLQRPKSRQLSVASDMSAHKESPRSPSCAIGKRLSSSRTGPSAPCTPLQRLDVNVSIACAGLCWEAAASHVKLTILAKRQPLTLTLKHPPTAFPVCIFVCVLVLRCAYMLVLSFSATWQAHEAPRDPMPRPRKQRG